MNQAKMTSKVSSSMKVSLPVACTVKLQRFGGLWNHFGIHLCSGMVLHRTRDGFRPICVTPLSHMMGVTGPMADVTTMAAGMTDCWIGEEISTEQLLKHFEMYYSQRLPRNHVAASNWQREHYIRYFRTFQDFNNLVKNNQGNGMMFNKVTGFDENNVLLGDLLRLDEVQRQTKNQLKQFEDRKYNHYCNDHDNIEQVLEEFRLLNEEFPCEMHLSVEQRKMA